MKKIYPFLFFAGTIFALPHGPTIVSGTIDMSQNSSHLEVFASNRAIINWEDFSILDGEKAIFNLAAPTHAILNRVTGPNQSLIFGQLECNGQMVLINPSGVLFGPHSTINTSSLLISTLDLLDENFLNGTDLHFFGGSSEIVSQGEITTEGDLYFLAPSIKHTGTCRSQNGEIIIASCSEAILNTPDGKIRLLPLEEMKAGEMLKSLQDRLLFEGNLSSLAINLDGIIETSDLLVAGRQIDLGPNSAIDLTHSENGGKCRILATESISIARSAHIDASSLTSGHGGEVILFSDGATHFEGRINAQGGPLQGDGGFVEVSGSHLAFRGNVSTLAPNGKTGTLLLDPVDITITNSASMNVNGLPTGPNFTPVNGSTCAGTGATSSILLTVDLEAAMAVNAVTISTLGSIGACNGDIIFDSAVTFNTTNALSLSAEGSVLFNASVTNLSSGAISITQAGANVIVTAGAAATSVETNGGPISITGVVGNLEIQGGTAMNALGRIAAFGATLDVDVGGDIIITGGSQSGASASLRNSVNTMTISNAANIIVTGGTNSGADASIFAGSNANAFITCDTMTVNTTASGAPVTVSADGDLNLNVTNGDLQILADNGGSAIVNASFNLDAAVSNNILLNATNNGYAAMFGDKGNATIEAVNGSITATATNNGFTQMYSGLNGVNPLFLLVIAGTNITTTGNGSFDSFSPTGGITIVVDNLFPTSPGIGPGQLNLGAGTTVNGTATPLQLFTADPSQNSILATLNAVPFVQGPPLTDTNTERYGIYYPNAFFVADYVVFYKIPINSPIPTPVIPVIVGVIQPEMADFAEMFRLLSPYSEYIYGSIRFSEKYEDPETLLGIPEQPDDFYRLRKKSTTRGWTEIVYDPAKF